MPANDPSTVFNVTPAGSDPLPTAYVNGDTPPVAVVLNANALVTSPDNPEMGAM